MMPVLRQEFGQFITDNKIAKPKDPYFRFFTDVLVQIYLHKQADPETMVGILTPQYGSAQEVADKLLNAVELDLLDFNKSTGKFILKYNVTNDIEKMLEKYQYPLPMVIPPREIKTNKDTGYITIKKLVVSNNLPYFKEKDLCLDHLNRMNQVALCLSEKVINSKQGKYIKPNREPDEPYERYSKRVKQAYTFYNSSMLVMREILNLTDKIFMTYSYDGRGRSYSNGYHINPQGSPYHKAVLELHNKELITS